VAAGADPEVTVLKTGIFRATLEDAVDEAGSVVLRPTRRHRPGVADRDSPAAAVDVARAGMTRRVISNRDQAMAGRAFAEDAEAAASTMVRRVVGGRAPRMVVGRDFVEVAGGRADRARLHRW
jgi:hypothetical protein